MVTAPVPDNSAMDDTANASEGPTVGSVDPTTLIVYDGCSSDYAAWTRQDRPNKFRKRMIRRLPKGGSVLDLGCGAGWDSAVFLASGLQAIPVDASAGLAREAERLLGIPVRRLPFDQLDEPAIHDGAWASFSLQHVPRDALPDVLSRIARALKAGGWLYVGVQEGEQTRRDRLGRLYCHYRRVDLEARLSEAGFGDISCETSSGIGYDGSRNQHLNMEARKLG